MHWGWPQFEPLYRDLAARPLEAASLGAWLADWSRVSECVDELYNRLYVATTVNTGDATAAQRYGAYLDEVYPRAMQAEQQLKEKLLQSGLQAPGFEIPLRNMRAEADLFCEANLPLLSEEQKLSTQYDRIISQETVEWEGKEATLTQLTPLMKKADRELRESVFRLAAQRQLADREAINALWQKLLALRLKLAANAGKSDYRAYRWQQFQRFDYTPQDCLNFHRAIEEVVVPAAARIYERRRQRLGVQTLRPWDLDVDPFNRPPLTPFRAVDELETGVSSIFHQVDPQLGAYFDLMRREGLLDLANRKGKAPGGYCTTFAAVNRPFIFANAVGLHNDVQTLLHEGGHSFHAFEVAHLPYFQQKMMGNEFAEVASMGMELLASPYLAREKGGFYSAGDAARARIEHLESSILFWPYMAVVDAFQHWVYEHPAQAADPAQCDAQWDSLWQRFMRGVDWSGLEDVRETGWHRKLHIHTLPFYYVEYGFAQLGAVQVWRNSLQDQAGAVARYRQALALGGTRPLPDLFRAAGARLAFDAGTLRQAVELMENTIEELEEI